jgi:hypothetical protein
MLVVGDEFVPLNVKEAGIRVKALEERYHRLVQAADECDSSH